MSWLSGRPIYSRNSLLQIYYQNQYTHKLMEIEETLAAQLHTQPEQQQSYFNPENTNNKIPSQFETQVSNTTRHTLPYNSLKQKQFPIKELKDKKLTASLDIQSIKKTKHSQSFSHIEKLSSRFDYKNVDKIDERQQNPNKDYKDLTLKLESALEKINSKNEKNEKSIKSNGEEVIHRFKKQEEKKKKEIHQKKQNLEQNKAKELQDKPTINQYSEKLAKETGHKPIHLRLQQLMAEKKRKMEENQQRKKKQEEQEEQQFLQEYNKYAKRPQNLRSYEAYFNEMVKWQEKKTRAMKQKLQTKQSKELEGITFTPSLNQKSLKMVSSHHRLPIQQRAFLKKKQKVEVRKQKFKPQLNQK